MDRKIKTRQVHKDIKILDKTATMTDHVKQSYVRTKENVMQSTEKSSDRENNPVGYAEDAASEYADRIFHETGHQVRRQAGKIIERKKEKASVSSAGEETVYPPKEQIRPVPPSGGEKAQEQGKELAIKKIKTIERDKRTIKTGKASEQVVKNTGKGTIKTSGKLVKTAEQTAKTSIKTSEQTANASVRAMHYSMKKAEKAVQTARQTAQNTRIAVKKTAKAVTHAIKALIEATKALLSALTAGGWIAVMILIIVILFGYANQYGIGEYVELIKAIMMQESGGRGLDPMQCSEGSFNTKYPRQPNGITDPEYSISCGVQEIKSCLERAGVKNPLDMENIKLALQSYNYGNGYLEWAKARGGYTLANAAEFSDMMAQRMGWSSYGDKQYVPHVLQYYAFGRIPTGIGNQAIVQVAASQEGKGGTTYWSWYGFGSRVEWCACFVSWCADQSGYIQSGAIPKFSLCSDGVKWFESKGRFRDASYTPAVGDIIFFDWGNNGTIDHVGIVESVSCGTVNTIEGNSGDKVARRSYSIGSSNIYGYGVPAY
ncbi:MAG: lysozyme family protein [Clostridiales bacterium]|nr:lysozyme family protein [Clostridiales bacterium]